MEGWKELKQYVGDFMCKVDARIGQMEKTEKEAYERGLKIGEKIGMEKAWDVACKIVNMMGGEREYIFGHMTSSSVMNKFSATEAIEKIKQCGQGQEEIEYGDEIQFCDGVKALVLDVDDEKLSVVTKRGFTDISMWKGNVTKTGEKYITIADYLRKIRDGYEF